MTRDQAWCLLTEFTLSESLRKHALSVEACLRAYARKFGEDEELWGIVGLIHDFDYEKYPFCRRSPVQGERDIKGAGLSRRSSPRDSVARKLQRRAARDPDGEDAFRLRRTRRIHHRQRPG